MWKRARTYAWIVFLFGCYDDLHVGEGDHPCEKCRDCEQCEVQSGSAVCVAAPEVAQICDDDGNPRWVDACGEPGEVVMKCDPAAIGCIASDDGKLACKCPANRTGDKCDVCAHGFDGAQSCNGCAQGWTGKSCDVCGELWDASRDCSVCVPGRTGADCTQCAPNWDPRQECKECVPFFDRETNCTSCLPHRHGDECVTCDENWDARKDCKACTGHWDTAENCLQCLGNRDAKADCETCRNHWVDDGNDCGTCPEGWSAKDDCRAVCGNGTLETGEACDDTLQDGFCQACKITSFAARGAKSASADLDLTADGTIVYAWEMPSGDGSGSRIEANIQAPDGTLGTPFQVNTVTAGNQIDPRVQVASDGSFAVVWVSGGEPHYQWFDATGGKLGVEGSIDSLDIDLSDYFDRNGSYTSTMLSNDQLLIVGVRKFYAVGDHRYALRGVRIAKPDAADSGGYDYLPTLDCDFDCQIYDIDVAAGPNGTYRVVWPFYFDPTTFHSALVSGEDVTLTSLYAVSDEVSRSRPQIAHIGNGTYMIAWDASIERRDGSTESALGVGVIDSSSSAPTFIDDPNVYTLASVCSMNGELLVAWRDNSASGDFLVMQRFGMNGAAIGKPSTISATSFLPDVIGMACSNSRIAAAWSDFPSSNSGVRVQRVKAPSTLVGKLPW